MDYVLVSNDSVITGPIPWNYRIFESSLQDDLDISFSLPRQKTDEEPIVISPTVKILPVVFDPEPSYNSKIEFLHGPFWIFSDEFAIGHYIVQNKNIEVVKNELKAKAASIRYTREVGGISVVVQGSSYTILTDRESRSVFAQALQLNADNVSWKFKEGFLILNISDIQKIVNAVQAHVQSQFMWEANKVAEIDSALTLTALDSISFE